MSFLCRLECGVCESPREMFEKTKWLYAANYSFSAAIDVKLMPSTYLKDRDLALQNVKESKAGLYVCQRGRHLARPYILHVFKEETTRKVFIFN